MSLSARPASRTGLLIITGAVLLAGGAFAASAANGSSVRVVITENGFEPAEVSVRADETVTFVNESGKESWPASNPHPTHTTYPSFDPQRPLNAGEEWTVTFTRPGLFYYHDHLNEVRQGKIRVADSWYSRFIPRASADCLAVPEDELLTCMEQELRDTIAHEGLEPAFALFMQYYRTVPRFVETSCHWHAHLLGEEAYRLYEAGGQVDLVPEVSYCGYGFFHGFMARLVSESGDYAGARAFCEQAGDSIASEAPSARINCFHGIGHGFIEDPIDPRFYGKPQELWRRSFDVCDRISPIAREREECIEGAFNGVVLFMEAGRFGLTLDRGDLFKWCREEEPTYQQGCYYEFAQKLDSVIKNDLVNLPAVIETVPEQFKESVVAVAVAGVMQQLIEQPSHTDMYRDCQILPTRALRLSCLRGIVGGYRAHGEPGTAHERAFAFCADSAILPDDAQPCYTELIGTFGTLYGRDKMRALCDDVPARYRSQACASVGA